MKFKLLLLLLPFNVLAHPGHTEMTLQSDYSSLAVYGLITTALVLPVLYRYLKKFSKD